MCQHYPICPKQLLISRLQQSLLTFDIIAYHVQSFININSTMPLLRVQNCLLTTQKGNSKLVSRLIAELWFLRSFWNIKGTSFCLQPSPFVSVKVFLSPADLVSAPRSLSVIFVGISLVSDSTALLCKGFPEYQVHCHGTNWGASSQLLIHFLWWNWGRGGIPVEH